jgi:hypothetical protein
LKLRQSVCKKVCAGAFVQQPLTLGMCSVCMVQQQFVPVPATAAVVVQLELGSQQLHKPISQVQEGSNATTCWLGGGCDTCY